MQVMPGFQRARQNWRRSANLAAIHSLPPPRPELVLHPAPLPAFLPASIHGGVRLPTMRSSAASHVRASRGGVPPSPEEAALALGEFAPTTSAARMSTPRPMGRSRQRSRSMTSPNALLEEYKMRWTCKVSQSSVIIIIISIPCSVQDCHNLRYALPQR